MRKISIDELIDMVDSRYSLVTIISKRARQIIEGQEVFIDTDTIKPVGIAIEEFYDRKYGAIYNLDQYKKEQQQLAEEAARLENDSDEDLSAEDIIGEDDNAEDIVEIDDLEEDISTQYNSDEQDQNNEME